MAIEQQPEVIGTFDGVEELDGKQREGIVNYIHNYIGGLAN